MYKKTSFVQRVLFVIACAGAITVYAHNELKSKSDPAHFAVQILSAADSTRYLQIDQLLTEAFNKGRFNGHVLYAEGGKILYNKAFGYRNLRTKEALTDSSLYQLASTSKPITAVAVLKLHQSKKLDINQLVVSYLPDFPYKNVTIKHLLQHRSGLPNYIYQPWDYRKTMTNSDLSPLLRKQKLRLSFTPGSRFQYCNTNYAYLALIVETVSGIPFANYVKKEIFEPLGMSHTFVYEHTLRNNLQAVKGYDYRRKGFVERPCDYLDGVVGDKGVYSTANDLFLFDQALYNYTFLSRSLIEQAFTPAEPFSEAHTRDYGLGFRVKLDETGSPLAYHHGWWKGFRTYFVHDYHNDRTLIWLNNRSDVHISTYMDEILKTSASDEDQQALGGGDR